MDAKQHREHSRKQEKTSPPIFLDPSNSRGLETQPRTDKVQTEWHRRDFHYKKSTVQSSVRAITANPKFLVYSASRTE